MFGIGGERDLTERELPHLTGWRGSAPVRVGNGAWRQRQLDVYGELLSAVHRSRTGSSTRRGQPTASRTPPPTRRFLVDLADTAARRWQEEDHGIWEIRANLAIRVLQTDVLGGARPGDGARRRLDAADRVDEWTRTRDDIRQAILSEGWSERAGAFTQSFGSDDLDASNLMLPLVGFLPADDPRDAGDHRGGRGAPHRRAWAGLPLPPARRARRRGRHLPAVHVLAGPRAGAGRPARPGAGGLRAGGRPSSTTSACSPKRSTARPASCSATSRRRSATSVWSTRRGRSRRRNAAKVRVAPADQSGACRRMRISV